MSNILLEKAIEYSKKGWYVFPCREREGNLFLSKDGKTRKLKPKTPYLKGGFQIASKDLCQIKKWWSKFPNAAIGVSCGHSNLIVVDIDTHKGDNLGYDNFMSLNVSDEGALHSSTPTGGLHIIYKGLTNSHANVRAGIDLRSKGAYFIVPPSFIFSENGSKLRYIELDDWSREPCDVPPSLVEKLNLLRNPNKPKNIIHIPIRDLNKTIKRAKEALQLLPEEYYDEYFKWINVGLSLKSLGDSGFILWNEWSKKSNKYNEEDCKYKWERFNPKEIGIGSLFYLAKESRKNGKNRRY